MKGADEEGGTEKRTRGAHQVMRQATDTNISDRMSEEQSMKRLSAVEARAQGQNFHFGTAVRGERRQQEKKKVSGPGVSFFFFCGQTPVPKDK